MLSTYLVRQSMPFSRVILLLMSSTLECCYLASLDSLAVVCHLSLLYDCARGSGVSARFEFLSRLRKEFEPRRAQLLARGRGPLSAVLAELRAEETRLRGAGLLEVRSVLAACGPPVPSARGPPMPPASLRPPAQPILPTPPFREGSQLTPAASYSSWWFFRSSAARYRIGTLSWSCGRSVQLFLDGSLVRAGSSAARPPPSTQYVIPVVSGFWSFFSYDLCVFYSDRRTQALVGAGPRSLESPGSGVRRFAFLLRHFICRSLRLLYPLDLFSGGIIGWVTSWLRLSSLVHRGLRLAMAEEIAALERTGTWDLVSPPGVRPITCKWVYKIKTRSDGSLERYKARLVARGFQQEHGRDYDKTFAPVAHMTTVRTLLAVASFAAGLSPSLMLNAFLNGELSEEVYMQPPPGYSVPDGMVCRLRRSLYGLKQAPRAWFERFASVVTAAGFSPSLHDPALFVHTSPHGRTLLLLYVDDMIITGDDPEYIAFVKARLRDQFLMTDLGPLRYFLGIEVSSTSDGFSISQEKYIQDLLLVLLLGMSARDTPMELNVKLRPDGDPLPDPTVITILLGVLFILLSLVLIFLILFIF
ncbi:hypothetical protein QYE76_010419 [Lolium multiflorum]|uniref:Reverse transcriptase Ty1/copia-type domain-containing protein n=1 Tax=Lolium multiflorum TaxID=4521 RepID=A0AAD8X4B7_LOLMU|nr:hypothetical protein QYE76_010419 [Lolium multiflorum]